MPKAHKDSTPVTMDFPLAEDRSCALADLTVNFVTIRQDHDLAPILAKLPTGRCECPHWGVVSKGRITASYPGQADEVYEAGDAFYMTPGHTAAAVAGTEFVQFSPSDLLAETEAAIAAAMAGSAS
jgi:hypothetical protein